MISGVVDTLEQVVTNIEGFSSKIQLEERRNLVQVEFGDLRNPIGRFTTLLDSIAVRGGIEMEVANRWISMSVTVQRKVRLDPS